MKKGIFKRITAFMLAIAMVCTMLPTTVIAATKETTDRSIVTASKDGITVTKHASFVKNTDGTIKTDEKGNPKIQIDFTVDTTNLTPETETIASGTTDIVLVIDKSGSMENSGKIGKAKEAAKDFIDKVLKYSDVQVGLVTFSLGTEKTQLTNDKTTLNKAINSIKPDGGTFIQAGLYQAQQMLVNSKATNKIIVLLSDGLPTYRYKFKNKNDGGILYWIYDEDTSKKTITAPLANPTSYDAYCNINYQKNVGENDYFDLGEKDYNWNDVITKSEDSNWDLITKSKYSKIKKGYEATISQAYLAREAISGLNIYSVGYDIESGKSAEKVLKTIADNGKYSSASVSGTNDLASVITNITKQVEKAINGVNLVDQIPSQMSLVEGTATIDDNADITAKPEDGGIKFAWNGALEKEKVYKMSFETVLNLNDLNAADFKDNNFFNTNGTTVVKDDEGANSSTLSYGTTDEAKITLDSPQLQLQSYKYDIHYFYDGVEDTGEGIREEGYKFEGQQVNVSDKNKDASEYVFDRVEINNSNGTFGNLTIDSEKTVNVYYKTKPLEPSVEPTVEPSVEPTVEPTVEPSVEPTVEPTVEPSVEPTVEPSVEPTVEPSVEPTVEPSVEPTVEPTENVTVAPTENPNPPLKPLEPTVEPTEKPSVEPSEEPTENVTVAPTENPNAPSDSEDEVRDDDSKEEVVKPATPNHLQAPVTSDKDTTDAQNGNDDTPKTSDDNNMMLYCLYMLLSATGIVVVYSRKRKNKA